MSEKSILVERDGAIGWIRMNRPSRLNAFAGTMRADLRIGLEQLDADPDVRCVIITGVGRAFSTGGDISVMTQLLDAEDEAAFEAVVRAGADVVRTLDAMQTPTIAAVNGPAAGAGACLALACDLRVASESASLGLGFLRVGLHPDWGGSYFLPRLVGPALATELILTGSMVSAERGERLGLFNRVVPSEELEGAVRGLAGQIASAPEDIVRAARRVLRDSLGANLDEVLEQEVAVQNRAFASPDFREGVTAFLAKRSPRFNQRPRPGAEE